MRVHTCVVGGAIEERDNGLRIVIKVWQNMVDNET